MRFVLVHGGCHGAWCWDYFIPELGKRGHSGVSMDLPGHGERRSERSTVEGYRDAVLEVLRPGDVVVGHSMGFWVATMAVNEFLDIAHICSIAGQLPSEGQPMIAAQGGSDPAPGAPKSDGMADRHMKLANDGRTMSFDPEGAKAVFYHDCDPAIAEWACQHLTAQQIDVLVEVPVGIPNFWAAGLPRSCIRCVQDRVMPAAFYEATIRRLGVREIRIDSSHSPFLSRPSELADVLLQAIETVPIGPLLPR